MNEEDEEEKKLISQSTINMIYTCMLPLALIMITYASVVYFRRRRCLRTKEVRKP